MRTTSRSASGLPSALERQRSTTPPGRLRCPVRHLAKRPIPVLRADDVRRQGPGAAFRRSRCGALGCAKHRGRCCSTTPASAPRARSAGPAGRRPFDRLAAGGLQLQPLPRHGPVLADAGGRCWPPRSTTTPLGMGGGRGVATSDAGVQHPSVRTARRPWPRSFKLNGYSTAAAGQVPRGPRWGTEPHRRSSTAMAPAEQRLRVLLRLHQTAGGEPVGTRPSTTA